MSWICSKLAAPMPETVLGRGNDSTRSFVDACAFSAVVRACLQYQRDAVLLLLLDLRAVSAGLGKSKIGNLPIRRASLTRTIRTGLPTQNDGAFSSLRAIGMQPCTCEGDNAGRPGPAQEVRTYASGGFRDCVAVPLITHPIAPWKQDSGPQGHTMWRRPLDGPENAAEMFFGCQTRRRRKSGGPRREGDEPSGDASRAHI